MEQRNANMIIGKAGGNASQNAYNCKVSIPKKWADALSVTESDKALLLSFDGEKITIAKARE